MDSSMFVKSGTVKSRSIPGPIFRIEERNPPGSNVVATVVADFTGTQITESDRNRWPLPPNSGRKDIGSEFYSQRRYCLEERLPFTMLVTPLVIPSWPATRTSGPLIGNCMKNTVSTGIPVTTYNPSGTIGTWKPEFPPDLSSSRAQLEFQGTKAVAAISPGNPAADVATALAELRQGLPAIPLVELWRSRVSKLRAVKGLAGEYLNYQFGIDPLLADIKKAVDAYKKYDQILLQFERDAGRVVRRRFEYPIERTITQTELGNIGSPPGLSAGSSPLAYFTAYSFLPRYKTLRTRETTREAWFSGAFTYYLPLGYDNRDEQKRRALARKLVFGAELNLEVLWNLAPWSWFVDWFGNLGSIISNIQTYLNYGTILRYGYMMEKTTTIDTYTIGDRVLPSPDKVGLSANPYPSVSSIRLCTETKKRVQAGPFNFGLTWEGLSLFQQSILAALGITRVVR